MKLSKVLLRWYKSFNVSYDASGNDRQEGAVKRPWNLWKLPDGREEMFPFIEISTDADITTVVGANESGKSHLLNAISKVITGKGVPGDPFSSGSEPKSYTQTDLCHFSSLLGKNLEIWPHIGVEFDALTKSDIEALLTVLDRPASSGGFHRITLILTEEAPDKMARLYLDETVMYLNADMLKKVRACLPRVLFINSQLAIADEVPLTDLLAAYGSTVGKKTEFFSSKWAQTAARFLVDLVVAPNQAVPEKTAKQVEEIRSSLASSRNEAVRVQLELMLFRDVLGISVDTLEVLFRLEDHDRGHAESLIARWNEEIERRLNLSRYWQQDQEFSLKINYKKSVLYFEITDKTGCVYTFRERSSGLRYFLSYYIQAKALEASLSDRDAIILMDEPDSFLSILGQRNLLSIFESLVSESLSKQKTQLLYTTHSPFLINRNFPARIRLVRKGDGEEGTQFVEKSRVRRFEPVRSALGIDLAQTLFMGGTNILLEGPSDQFLISEAIRCFSGGEGMNDLLDLNSVVLVSAESASGVEQVLASSTWTDEPIPTAIVVLDDDEAGNIARRRITGKMPRSKKLIPDEFALLISEMIGPFGKNVRIASVEDIVPCALYGDAVIRYFKRWFQPSEEQSEMLRAELGKPDFATNGLVAGTVRALETSRIQIGGRYDKLGVLQEVLAIIREGDPKSPEIVQLKTNILSFSRCLRAKIEESDHAEKLRSGKQAIHRLVGEFFVKHKEAATPYELELVFTRLEREAALFGDDADELRVGISSGIGELKKLRSAGRQSVTGPDWEFWRDVLERIRKNPLRPNVTFSKPAVSGDVTVLAPPTSETSVAESIPPAKLQSSLPSGAS